MIKMYKQFLQIWKSFPKQINRNQRFDEFLLERIRRDARNPISALRQEQEYLALKNIISEEAEAKVI
jgi:hypothetical protein